jgi:hypothetical protein
MLLNPNQLKAGVDPKKCHRLLPIHNLGKEKEYGRKQGV